MKIISNEETVGSTVQSLKEFNSHPLVTHGKKREHLVSLMPANEKAFDSSGDDMVDLSMENEPLKNKMGSYDKTGLEESESMLLKQFGYEKRAN